MKLIKSLVIKSLVNTILKTYTGYQIKIVKISKEMFKLGIVFQIGKITV